MMDTRVEIPETKTEAELIDWALGLNRFTLRFMGVWPDEEVNDEQSLTVLLRVPFMILSMFLFLILPQTYALTLVIKILPLVIENLMISWATFTSCLKLYFVWRNKKLLQPVIKSITEDWLCRRDDWELRTMKRHAYRARFFTVAGFVIILLGYSGIAFAPLLGIQMRTITNLTDRGERHLSVQAAYPYDYSRSPIFEMMEMSQIFAGFFVLMSISVPDNYFGVLVFHVCAQFEILGNRIQKAVKDSNEFDANFSKELRTICKRHVHLLLVVTTLEEAFSFVMASQVLSTSVMLVCFGFQIQDLLNSAIDKATLIRLLTMIACLSTLLLHVFVDCLASEALVTYNAGILHNVYISRWYLIQNHNVRDLVPIMVMACKQSKPLTAGKIFDLTLESYCSLLKTSMGYISILLAVNGD